MAGSHLRIKSSRVGYRRAGLIFGADWTELAEQDLTDEQTMKLLADPVLTIQERANPKADWTPLSAEYRRQITTAHTVTDDGSGEALAELGPEQLRFAELGRDLESAIFDNQDLLESLDLWPVAEPARFFLDLANRLVKGEGERELLAGAMERLAAQPLLAAAIEPHEATLDDLGIPLADHREVLPRTLAALISARAEIGELRAAQTITPPSDGPDGGGGDPAAPAAVPPAEGPKPPATAGGDAARPASKPKPAAGKKPATSKAGA